MGYCCNKTHTVETKYIPENPSCEEQGKGIKVDETEIVWKKKYVNDFGIKEGDDLECIIRKINKWFECTKQEIDEKITDMAIHIEKLERGINNEQEL